MWKGIALVALLAGCTSTAPAPVIVDVPVYHPAMPSPYSVCNVVWDVVEIENSAKVVLSYNDNLTMAICLGDIERYVTQLINVSCHYRQELKEYICNKGKN